MDTCKGCERELPDDAFYRHARMASGHLSFCKACFKAKMRAHRAANIERFQAYDRQRSELPHRRAAIAAYQASRPDVPSRAKKKWREGNPEKRKAHTAARRIPLPEACQRCGAGGRLHRHHPDYSQPTFVEFLCTPCHGAAHREINKARRVTAKVLEEA
jgi:hypothetical protein